MYIKVRMPYIKCFINLTTTQQQQFIHAIQNDVRVTIRFLPSQIGVEHDAILVTMKQYNKLQLAKQTNSPVNINFNKTQLRLMHKQMGYGILSSISNFFKAIPTKIGNAASSVKNYFSTPSPAKPKIIDINRDYGSNSKLSKNWTKVDNKVPTNADLNRRYKNINKPSYNPKNTYVDYGSQYDHLEPGYTPPKPSSWDWAEKVDNGINRFFSY
jgi:hypothetical protein